MLLSRFRNLIRILPPSHQRCMSTTETGDASITTASSSTTGDSASISNESSNFDREFVDMKVEHFEDLYRGNSDKKELITLILNEYEFIKYNQFGRVPTKLELKDMVQMMDEGPTSDKRERLFHFMFKREMEKLATKRRLAKHKEEVRLRRIDRYAEFDERGAPRTGLLDYNGGLVYGLWHNNLLCRVPENQMKTGSSGSRLRVASQFGRKLIFDFGFEEYMSRYTARNSIDQIQESYGLNRFKYSEPFDFWFCNFNKESLMGQYCSTKAIQNLHTTSMITVKEDCFTNHFDKDQLVYLSPDAREPLNNRVHKSDDIYIVGVFNDKGNHQPVSFRKAMKLGIRARRLPLDTHLAWQGAGKSLCVNHVTGIMLEVISNGGDWHSAFTKHIPTRKIKPMEQVIQEEAQRQERWNLRSKRRSFSLRDIVLD